MHSSRKNLSKLASFLVLLFLIAGATAQGKEGGKVFVVNLLCCSEKISLSSVFVKNGYPPDKKIQPENGYEYKIFSTKGKILYSYKFLIPGELSLYCSTCSGGAESSSCTNGGCATTTNSKSSEPASLSNIDTTATLIAPYFEDAKAINIYDPAGKLQLEVSVLNLVPKPEGSKTSLYIGLFLVAAALIGGTFIYLRFYKKPKTA